MKNAAKLSTDGSMCIDSIISLSSESEPIEATSYFIDKMHNVGHEVRQVDRLGMRYTT